MRPAIEAVLRGHTDQLMAIEGVVGTAQGDCAGEPCIRVFVEEDTPDIRRRIPTSLDGYAVEIVPSGPIRAFDAR